MIEAGDPPPAECPGSPANPQAQPGNLCIFVEGDNSVGTIETYGTADGSSDYRFGAGVYSFAVVPSDTAELWDTWAVTAP